MYFVSLILWQLVATCPCDIDVYQLEGHMSPHRCVVTRGHTYFFFYLSHVTTKLSHNTYY